MDATKINKCLMLISLYKNTWGLSYLTSINESMKRIKHYSLTHGFISLFAMTFSDNKSSLMVFVVNHPKWMIISAISRQSHLKLMNMSITFYIYLNDFNVLFIEKNHHEGANKSTNNLYKEIFQKIFAET